MLKTNKQGFIAGDAITKGHETAQTILIVDHDLPSCVLWAKHLVYRGWDVQTAVSKETAGLAIARRLPRAIILDVNLANEASGWDLLAELRSSSKTQNLPVFIVSAVDEPRQARTAGATGFLLKPCSPILLVSRISEALAQ